MFFLKGGLYTEMTLTPSTTIQTFGEVNCIIIVTDKIIEYDFARWSSFLIKH